VSGFFSDPFFVGASLVRRACQLRCLVFSLLIVLQTMTPVAAWWDAGHFIVALIAYQKMDPETRAQVVHLLRQHPQQERYFAPPEDLQGGAEQRDRWVFAQAGVWADRIRRTEWDRPTWHYVNLPLFLSDADKQKLNANLPINRNSELPSDADLDTAGLNVIQAIKLCRKTLQQKDATDLQKSLSVAWLFHLVGDVHQPCHSTALFTPARFQKGDRGGNGIPLVRIRNLHQAWDSALGNSRKLTRQVQNQATEIVRDTKAAEKAQETATLLNPSQWVAESRQLATQVAYHEKILTAVRSAEQTPDAKLKKIALPETYYRELAGHARQRAAQAGFRLARLLQEDL
tara:strand:- start:3242 stop:4273 length:1032 start_codon:yes stop_codon:yes gene_type:complete